MSGFDVAVVGGARDVVLIRNGDSKRAGLFYAPSFHAKSRPAQLGCELDDNGVMVIDADGRTSLPGVFGAGDATVGKAAVVLAAAAGSRAAYAINADLARGLLPIPEPVGAPA